MKFENNGIRFDLQLIASWIEPGSKVLDLGCGDGNLLHFLKKHQQVEGTGIEKEEEKVAGCISKGLSVLQGDINTEVLDFPDKAFDYVILSQTLQQVFEPDQSDPVHTANRKKWYCQLPQFQPLAGSSAIIDQRLCPGYPPTPLSMVRHPEYPGHHHQGF